MYFRTTCFRYLLKKYLSVHSFRLLNQSELQGFGLAETLELSINILEIR